MPAWKVTKLWSDKEIGEYRAYVAKEGPNKAKQGLKDATILLGENIRRMVPGSRPSPG